ncbi:hypothetical protein PCASD_19504 [Puccinia coronata f. sp. avenae]|uniref:Protein kinase domain-containing protein n=1 Tax=Puccinia coronata f. sp. avenae TaxID=200324 RepID=A0A2N5SLD1_9BASI|nr:hypothetical protein PCASD_19504 [Puccinia coronata f. sp. avenae]
MPDKYLVDRSSRRKLFFDSTGAPRPVVNSKGRRRRVGSKTLQTVLKTDDELFVDFIAKCLAWDPERRLKPDPAMRHPWILAGRARQPVGHSPAAAAAAARAWCTSRARLRGSVIVAPCGGRLAGAAQRDGDNHYDHHRAGAGTPAAARNSLGYRTRTQSSSARQSLRNHHAQSASSAANSLPHHPASAKLAGQNPVSTTTTSSSSSSSPPVPAAAANGSLVRQSMPVRAGP